MAIKYAQLTILFIYFCQFSSIFFSSITLQSTIINKSNVPFYSIFFFYQKKSSQYPTHTPILHTNISQFFFYFVWWFTLIIIIHYWFFFFFLAYTGRKCLIKIVVKMGFSFYNLLLEFLCFFFFIFCVCYLWFK